MPFLAPARRSRLLAALLVVVALAGVTWFQLARPLPAISGRMTIPATEQVAGGRPAVPWPAEGVAAIGATEIGLIDTSPGDRPLPMLSIAKVGTALQVLADHPLKPDEQGPSLTVSEADVADYARRKSAEESVVAVQAGEKLTEYQLLQGLLIPSANNYAAMLANWDAGSIPAFVARLNQRARSLGMRQTSYADPAGVDEATRSSPSDLAREAASAITDPVLAGIVAQPQASLPVAGTVYNVDYGLGQGGIAGIKTGSGNGSAGFMFASPHRVAGKTLTVVGAVMGMPTLDSAFAAARRLIEFEKRTIVYQQVLPAGVAVAAYDVPWQRPAALRTVQAADLVEWPGLRAQRRLHAPAARVPMRAGAPAGELEIRLGDQSVSVPLETAAAVQPAPTGWRLTRLA